MAENRQKIFTVISMLLILLINASDKPLFAKDFGVVGHTYEISEQDIILYIKTKLETLNIKSLQNEQTKIVRDLVQRPKAVAGIRDAKEHREYFYDPTFVLQDDIINHKGQMIHKAGTKINPLTKISLTHDLIFINGDNDEQVEFALKHLSTKHNKAKIILTNGSPIDLQKAHKIWIYFDQAGFLTSKFGIKQVPAIVTQDGLQLRINEVAL